MKLSQPSFRLEIRSAHQKPVRALAFSPDGQWLVSGSDDQKVCLWDTETGEKMNEKRVSTWGTSSLVFSQNGKMVAAVCAGRKGFAQGRTRSYLWNLIKNEVNEMSAEEHRREFRSPCFLQDAKTIAFKYRGIRLYDSKTREEIVYIPEGRKGDAIAFAPNGAQAVFGDWEGALHVWDVQTRQEVQTLQGHREYITNLAFSGDGSLLASASSSFGKPWESPFDPDRTIRLWDFHSGKELREFTGDWDATDFLAFLPDHRSLISFHDPQICPTLRMWSADADEAVSIWTPKENVCAVAMTWDGKWIATGDDSGKIRIWELATVMSQG